MSNLLPVQLTVQARHWEDMTSPPLFKTQQDCDYSVVFSKNVENLNKMLGTRHSANVVYSPRFHRIFAEPKLMECLVIEVKNKDHKHGDYTPLLCLAHSKQHLRNDTSLLYHF